MAAMLEPELMDLLRTYGIPRPEYRRAASAAEAVAGARSLGYPVVMKIVSPDVSHKSDVGGVRLGLQDDAAVRAAYADLLATVAARCPAARLLGAIIYPQAPAGLEVIAGLTQDPQFGPVLMFGLGGIFTEVLRDVSFRAVPIRRADARLMLREIRGRALLEGCRGQPPADEEALADLHCRLSGLAQDNLQIAEMDLNPVRVYQQGLLVLDVRAVLAPAAEPVAQHPGATTAAGPGR